MILKKVRVKMLYDQLNKMTSLKGVKFSYAVCKNLSKMRSEYEALEKAIEMSPEYIEKVENKRMELCKQYCLKDSNGRPVMSTNLHGQQIFQFSEEGDMSLNKDMEKILKKEKELVDVRKKQEIDYLDLLNTEVEIDFHMLKLEDVPADISTAQMNAIMEMLHDEN